MSARDNILNRVRGALGRKPGAAPESVPEARIRIPEATPLEERIARFCAALEALAGKTYVAASSEDAAAYVRSVVSDKPVVMTGAPVLTELGLEFAQAAVDKAQVGVTGADFGLADTGTVVVLSASEPRLASLLPPVHVAVLRKQRLLSGLGELLALLPKPAEQTASMVLITGPSRTADIEQILVRGVHGPGELHVVLV